MTGRDRGLIYETDSQKTKKLPRELKTKSS